MSSVVIRNETGDAKVAMHITQTMIQKHLRLAKQLKESATMLLNSLKLGATVEDGKGTAYLDNGSEQKPNWRAVLLTKCGQAAVDAARDATPRKDYCRLRVETAKTATK